MLYCALICVFLNDGGGLVILGMSAVLIFYEKFKFPKKSSYIIILLYISIGLYLFSFSFINELSFIENRTWVTLVVSVIMVYAVSSYLYSTNGEIVNPSSEFYEIPYWILYIYCSALLLLYIFTYWFSHVDPRGYKFGGSMHENEFAMILINSFILGIKLKHYYSSYLLCILAMFFLPSRTYLLFVFCYVFFYVFSNTVNKVRELFLLDTYFKIMLCMIIFLLSLSAIWVLILSWKYQLNQSHVGLFDTSNEGRFESILYAVRVIVEKNLYFKGIPVDYLETSKYSMMASLEGLHYKNMFIPHSSYILMMVQYSVSVCLIYLYALSKIFDRIRTRKNDAILLAYLATALIYHNMMQGGKMFILLSILLIPENLLSKVRRKKILLPKIRIKI